MSFPRERTTHDAARDRDAAIQRRKGTGVKGDSLTCVY
jgi:hypothetical protein